MHASTIPTHDPTQTPGPSSHALVVLISPVVVLRALKQEGVVAALFQLNQDVEQADARWACVGALMLMSLLVVAEQSCGVGLWVVLCKCYCV